MRTTTPSIQGKKYGVVANQNFYFHDGEIKGEDGAIQKAGGTALYDEEYSLKEKTESTYKLAYLVEMSSVRVAAIGSNTFPSLDAAIAAAPNNTETTIRILDNIFENVTIPSNKNIKLDLQTFTIDSVEGNSTATITNNGILTVQNGTIANNDYPVAILNKKALNITGGEITSSGVSNNGNSNNATVYDDNGTINITGGKIISNNTGNNGYAFYIRGASAVLNMSGNSEIISNNDTAFVMQSNVGENSINLGKNDNSINNNYPLIQGGKNGILNNSSQKINFYDGVIKSTKDTVNYSKIETPHYLYSGVEIIDNVIYGTTYLGNTTPKVAMLDGIEYDTLQEAITTASTNEKTITLIKSTRESVEVKSNQKLTIDFQDNTLANVGDANVIKTSGQLTILNGTLTTDAPKFSAIDVNGGSLTINGTTIINRGERQAVYNNGYTVTIIGDAYFLTSAPDRAALHNLKNGTMYIKSGTFIATVKQAIRNEKGTIYIGDDDGSIKNNIYIEGTTYGVTTENNANNKIYFYDGVIKGKTGVIDKEEALQSPQNGGRIQTRNEGDSMTATVVSN